MARQRAKNNKKTLKEVKKRLKKQIGGTGPLGGRGRELPPKEFEDAGVPRKLPPTATPMPTPKPTVNLPTDVEVQDTPDAPQKQQQQTESQQREAEKRKAEQDRKRAEEARQKAIEEAAKKAAQEAADRASDDIDIDGPFQIGEERIFGNRIFVWNGTTFVDTGRTVDEGDDGDEGSAGDEGDDGDDGDDDDGNAGGAGGAGGGAGEQTPTDPDALRKQIEDAAKGIVPESIKAPDAVKVDVGKDVTAETIDTARVIDDEDIAKITAPTNEQVSKITNVVTADIPEEAKVNQIKEIYRVPENVAIQIARGEVKPESLSDAAEVERVKAIEAAEVQIKEGAVSKRITGILTPESKAQAAKNAGTTLARVTRAKKQLRNAGLSEDDISELGSDPEALEDRLTDFTEEQRGVIEGLPEEALVSNQLDSLLQGIEEGEIPIWAKPAVDSVEAILAQRGLSASTVGRDALLNTIIQSALPLAQSNAQAIQQAVSQQRGIEAQALEANAQREQQASLQNAQNVFGLNMAQFNADQQRELSNSKFFQTISLANADNTQKSAVQNAVLMSQANLAEANFAQQSQINNAKNFLTMDMANLNNEQQSFMIKAQQEQQRILSNQASENARRQFNAKSQQQVELFNKELFAQIERFNVQQQNFASQFNAQAENAAEARRVQRDVDIDKANAAMVNQINQFNSQMEFNRDKFNTANKQAVAQSNMAWRRQANTINTAAQNAVNQQNAQNAFAMTSQSLSFLWQELRDQADFDFREAENAKNREAQLYATAIANEANGASDWNNMTGQVAALIKNLFGGD